MNAVTEAYLNALDSRPRQEHIYPLDQLIVGLMADGVWIKVIKMWWLGAHVQQASLVNMKNVSDPPPTLSDTTLTFAPYVGWTGNNLAGGATGKHRLW